MDVRLFDLNYYFKLFKSLPSSAYSPGYPPSYNNSNAVAGGAYGGGGAYAGSPYAGMADPAAAERMDQERQRNKYMITWCIVCAVCYCCVVPLAIGLIALFLKVNS